MGQAKPARFLDLLKRELPPNPSWIEPSILTKGGTLLFGGDAKIGKSLIMLEMARAIGTGSRPFNCPAMGVPKEARVLLIEQEVGELGLQKRGRKALIDVPERFADNIWYVTQEPDMQFDTPEGRKRIVDVVGDVSPNVVFFDPISRMHGYDENSNTDINKLVRHLANLKKTFAEAGMALVISHHFGKRPNDKESNYDPLDYNNFRGASKFRDDADTLITVQRLKYIDLPWKAWRIKTRFTLRHDEPPDDMIFTVNKDQDLRVMWEKTLGPTQELKPEDVFKTKQAPAGPTTQEKLLFRPA